MIGTVYITDDSGMYVECVHPYSVVSSITDALATNICFSPLDTEAIENFASDIVTKLILATDSLNWKIEVWELDRSAQWGTLIFDDSGIGIFGDDACIEEQQRALRRLATELSDYVSSAAITVTTRKAAGAFCKTTTDAEADATASASIGGTSEELDEIIEHIKKHTKADIVKPKESLADYVCDSTLKEELEEIKDFFENEHVYKGLNIKLPKGILFKGVPGTGKTFAARCIAGSTECYFMSCTASALQGMYVGSGAENIRLVFKGAKALRDASKKGVIIFIDEIDSFGSRESHKGGGGGEEDRTLNQLLAEMSGFEDEEGIMILAATNYPERLDDALMRSGRFSRQITIERPEEAARRNLIDHYFGKIKMPLVGTDVDEICALTVNFTPADIQEVANESAILAVRIGAKEISLTEVNEAVNKVITKNIRRPDKAGMPEVVAIHEIGHVVAELIYLNTISLKVTNFSYGTAGGFTQPAKILEGLITDKQLKGHVMALLGGRVAESMYGDISTGASEDLERAKRSIKAYYETYHFKPYKAEELKQLVLDTLDEWTNELYVKFTEPDVKTIIHKLIIELKSKRTLYQSDIAATASTLLTF
jgi:ATP-dependent Zn protease